MNDFFPRKRRRKRKEKKRERKGDRKRKEKRMREDDFTHFLSYTLHFLSFISLSSFFFFLLSEDKKGERRERE